MAHDGGVLNLKYPTRHSYIMARRGQWQKTN